MGSGDWSRDLEVHETSSDDDVTSSDEEFTKARVKDHAQMAKQAYE